MAQSVKYLTHKAAADLSSDLKGKQKGEESWESSSLLTSVKSASGD